MKAIVFSKYGSPDLLEFKEVEKPAPTDGEVLIKIHAASVNSWDYELMRGTPFVNRMMFGLFRPKVKTLGADIAGSVEAIGKKVERFKVGDEVFADLSTCGWGGYAEFVCVPEDILTRKPSAVTFEDAAAAPQAAQMAFQCLYDKSRIKPGQKVLINGAGGGVGSFAVQMAKSMGAEVTGVDKGVKLDMVRSLGADHVIDYEKEDFTKNEELYDLIVDTSIYRSIFEAKRSLTPKGIYIVVGGSNSRCSQVIFFGPIISILGSKKVGILGLKQNKDLADIGELIETGKLKPAIDRRYKLSEVPEALRYFGQGNFKGKIVITFEQNEKACL